MVLFIYRARVFEEEDNSALSLSFVTRIQTIIWTEINTILLVYIIT